MTALSSQTACAILASHGADPARWPAADRSALLLLAGSDPAVAAALAEAQAMDAMLAEWANAPAALPLGAIDTAAITALRQLHTQQHTLPLPLPLPLPQQQPQVRRMAGWHPAALAASLALVLAVGGWFGFADQIDAWRGGQSETRIAQDRAVPAGGDADLAFAYVFTPTAAEEDLI